jgi:hypothetical protein
LCSGNENWDDEGLENTPIIEGIDNSYAHIVPVGQTFKPDKRGVKVHYLPPFLLIAIVADPDPAFQANPDTDPDPVPDPVPDPGFR